MTRLRMLKPRITTEKRAHAAQYDSRRAELRTHRWKALRLTILDRDSGLCQPCLRMSQVTAATQVDHVIPRAQGGTDHPSNLQAICTACHEAKTKTEQGHA